MVNRGHYIPTTFYLDPALLKRITLLALATGKHKSEIVREVVHAGLERYPALGSKSAKTLLELAKLSEELGVKGPSDLSTNHDHYLYDE